MWSAQIASNMNLPAPLAVLGFVGACCTSVLAVIAVLVFWFAGKPKFAGVTASTIAVLAAVYLFLLLGFSAGSHEIALARGQEKYFCEIDCHLAYAVVDVKTSPAGRCIITLRTRFDETTTSPSRLKDATLTPPSREVRLIDGAGRPYAPVGTSGTPLVTPLKPADSYTTQFAFDLPKDATGPRLLINTAPAWPDHLVIGDENSWLHKKTYFAL